MGGGHPTRVAATPYTHPAKYYKVYKSDVAHYMGQRTGGTYAHAAATDSGCGGRPAPIRTLFSGAFFVLRIPSPEFSPSSTHRVAAIYFVRMSTFT